MSSIQTPQKKQDNIVIFELQRVTNTPSLYICGSDFPLLCIICYFSIQNLRKPILFGTLIDCKWRLMDGYSPGAYVKIKKGEFKNQIGVVSRYIRKTNKFRIIISSTEKIVLKLQKDHFSIVQVTVRCEILINFFFVWVCRIGPSALAASKVESWKLRVSLYNEKTSLSDKNKFRARVVFFRN